MFEVAILPGLRPSVSNQADEHLGLGEGTVAEAMSKI